MDHAMKEQMLIEYFMKPCFLLSITARTLHE